LVPVKKLLFRNIFIILFFPFSLISSQRKFKSSLPCKKLCFQGGFPSLHKTDLRTKPLSQGLLDWLSSLISFWAIPHKLNTTFQRTLAATNRSELFLWELPFSSDISDDSQNAILTAQG
jgi:hypothetical protein